MIGIIIFNAYWHNSNTNPVISTAVVVEADAKLADIIANEMTNKKSTADVVVALDLKSAKSFGGTDVKQLLNHPFSVVYNVIRAEEQKELYVVYENPILPQKSKPASFFDVLMQNATPSKMTFVSTHTDEECE